MAEQTQARYPLLFVTGVGQTWTSPRGSTSQRWNLFPREPKLLLGGLTPAQKGALLSVMRQAARYLTFGGAPVRQRDLQDALSAILRWCRVDDDGDLPLYEDVHIYGARSFAELGRVDFFSGAQTDEGEKTLLDRLLRDVPCRDFLEEFGAENMYCFNYSPFTDLYAAADALHETMCKIVGSRTEGKVVLVPMSMGAAVTVAYLDAYYHADGRPKQENYIDHIVSVVGAWDGSEGFADLLAGRVHPQWNTMLFEAFLPSQPIHPLLLRTMTQHPERVNTLLRQLLDALLDGVLMRSSAFLALVPRGRWDDLYPDLFSDARFARNTRLLTVQRQTVRFMQAQRDLLAKMRALHDMCGVRFSFVGGTGLRPGEGSSDFSFMRFFACADRTDTDGVLQQSSSMPFLADENADMYVQSYALFDRQVHEIGGNDTAMRLIFDLASGRRTDAPHFFPAQQTE